MARPAERDQVTERVRLHAFGVVDMQSCPCAALLALHAVTHLCPKSLFGKAEGFVAIAAASPNGRRVDMLIWAGCSLWMVARRLCVAGQVGMREVRFALLPVALAVKLLSGGEPLVRFQRVTAFAHLCVPAGSAVEPSGLFTDELLLSAALVLLQQPVEVTEPREPRDLLDVCQKTGVPVVSGPAPHDSVQGRQAGVLIHPRPVSGSQVFELLFHSLLGLGLGRRSKVYGPPAIDLLALDMKTQEVEAVVDVGDDSFFFR